MSGRPAMDAQHVPAVESRSPMVIRAVMSTLCGLAVMLTLTVCGLALIEARGGCVVQNQTALTLKELALYIFGVVSGSLISTRSTGGRP